MEAFCQLPAKADKTKRMTYGIASKIISIYVKTVEVIPSAGTSPISLIAHPPIDGILLKSINNLTGKKLEVHWSKFDEEKYFAILEEIRGLVGTNPLWHLESHWRAAEAG
jgi:hypothetical protein